MIDIYGLINEQKKTVKSIIDAFKVSNVSKEKNNIAKELKNVMNSKIMNNKIIMISPDYDLIGNNVEMTDSVPILVDKDNPFIPVYSCLWGKGWSTLSNPNTMKKYNRILFGKCNHDEIKLIRDATANTHLIVKREDIDDNAEAYNVEVMYDIGYYAPLEDIASSFCDFSKSLKPNTNPYPIIKKWDFNTL